MKDINRREFLKTLGAASLATAGLSSCGNKTVTPEEEINPNGTETSEVPTDKMEYRTNPNSGDKVSLLGYGCMRWPMIANPKGEGQIIDQEQVNALIDYALAHGVNYIDTAPVYCQGLSEEATGIALRRHPRDSYYIATKLSSHRAFGTPASPEEWREKSINMYNESFKKLGLDYIDYYLLHAVGFGADDAMQSLKDRFFTDGVLDFLVEEKKKGKIRNLGWSFHGDVNVFDYLLKLHDEGKYHWDFVQIQLNYVNWNIGSETKSGEYLYTELAKRNIPVVIMEPLLGGRLSKLPTHVLKRLKEKEPEKSSASWAFRYLGTLPGIMTCLSGMQYKEHLEDNIRSFAPFKALTKDEVAFLYDTAKIINDFPTVPCNDCKYCMPCPYGLDIPATFLHYNKLVNEGTVPDDMKDPQYAELRRRYLISYDRTVPKLRQASHCTGCGQCTPDCPQQIRIPSELQRIDQFIESLKQNTLGLEETDKKA